MSFSVNLNSVDGTKVVAGKTNQITYNFAFDKTPEHKGGYKVYMVFCSQFFQTRVFDYYYKELYINVGLGAFNSYSPVGLYTGTKNNSLLGVVRVDVRNPLILQVNPAPADKPNIMTTAVPVNSNTVAHTLSTSSVMPATLSFTPINQTVYSGYNDNPPVILTTKPTNNQFIVTFTNIDGAIHTETEFINTDYSMILTFEAV
jgi:hypothetical protein